MNYNYYEAVKEDVITAIEDDYYIEIVKEQLKMGGVDCDVVEALNDAMWTDDSITGNGSGSYWCNAWGAEEALCHNWNLIRDMVSEYMTDISINKFSPEQMDVSIRCFLLNSVLWDLVDEIIEMAEADESEEEIIEMEEVA